MGRRIAAEGVPPRRPSVILFGLVRDEGDSADPAPHLESRMEDFWIDEIYRYDGRGTIHEENLVAGLENVAKILCSLNSCKCEHAGYPSLSNPDISYIRRLEDRQVCWDFDEDAYRARDNVLE